jgi:hypothetical protein
MLAEVARRQECDQVDLSAKREPKQRRADSRRHPPASRKQRQTNDGREEECGCDTPGSIWRV